MQRFELHNSSIIISNDFLAFRQILKELYHKLWPQQTTPRPSQLAILTDDNTKKHCLPQLLNYLHSTPFQNIISKKEIALLNMPAGEEHKTWKTCQNIWRQMFHAGLDRHSLLIVLGGGVPCDLGGFCAATFMRGIPFIFLPTTLLAQTDASIGGKLGIDLDNTKNAIGLFQQPKLVFTWPQFLQTLSLRQIMNGWAELVKHALIANANLWQNIRQINTPNIPTVKKLLPLSVKIKHQIVNKDPLEQGPRKLLNFGHTIGHAIESLFLNTPEKLLHGEAIALGMALEAKIAQELNLLPETQYNEITTYLKKHYPYKTIPSDKRDKLAQYLLQDKKNRAGKIQLALIGPIGQGHPQVEVPLEKILSIATE